MIINNFDVGILGLVFQLYRKNEESQYNHECKLTMLLASDINDGNYYPPQDITIYGKSAITKLRDELIKYFPLDEFIPPVVEFKTTPTKVDITIKLPVKKYTFRGFESPRRFNAFQINYYEDNEISYKWPDWLIKLYVTEESLDPVTGESLNPNQVNIVYKSNETKSNSILTIKSLSHQQYIYCNDWIVQSEEGNIFGYDSEDFTRLFKEVN